MDLLLTQSTVCVGAACVVSSIVAGVAPGIIRSHTAFVAEIARCGCRIRHRSVNVPLAPIDAASPRQRVGAVSSGIWRGGGWGEIVCMVVALWAVGSCRTIVVGDADEGKGLVLLDAVFAGAVVVAGAVVRGIAVN